MQRYCKCVLRASVPRVNFDASGGRCRPGDSVRDLLEQLDHAVEDGEGDERVRELALAFTNACAECREHYLPQKELGTR